MTLTGESTLINKRLRGKNERENGYSLRKLDRMRRKRKKVHRRLITCLSLTK